MASQPQVHTVNVDPYGDTCNRCGAQSENCLCDYCGTCGEKPLRCVCEPCQCGNSPCFCTCPICQNCGRKDFECQCAPCVLCNQLWCNCVQQNDQKVLIGNRAFQYIDTTPITTADAWAPVQQPTTRTVILRGELDNCRILVIKKRGAIWTDFKQDLIDKTVSTRAKTANKWKQTALYTLYKKWKSKVDFWVEPEVESTHINVTTTSAVRRMVDNLTRLPRDGETMAIGFDCEGVNLGRDGETCYIQIRDYIEGQTYLVDLLKLGIKAWVTKGKDRQTTLKQLFEDANLVKLIYDCRGDADALYNDYGIRLAGVLDVQYLTIIAQPRFPTHRPGYDATMNGSGCLDDDERVDWNTKKHYDFRNDPVGYAWFKVRPLPQVFKMYAINDVQYLHRLASKLIADSEMTDRGLELAFAETKKEVEATWDEFYVKGSEPWLVPAEVENCWSEDINMHTKPRQSPSSTAEDGLTFLE